jgi:hypothetical protein
MSYNGEDWRIALDGGKILLLCYIWWSIDGITLPTIFRRKGYAQLAGNIILSAFTILQLTGECKFETMLFSHQNTGT